MALVHDEEHMIWKVHVRALHTAWVDSAISFGLSQKICTLREAMFEGQMHDKDSIAGDMLFQGLNVWKW